MLRKRPRPLRLRGSGIAKVVGLHPYGDLPKLVMDLVYQGRSDLRLGDSARLGLVWVSEEEEILELLHKADASTQTAFTELAAIKEQCGQCKKLGYSSHQNKR